MVKKPATNKPKKAKAKKPAAAAPRDLSPKQRLFVAEYIKDLNATQAAIRAGYSAKTAASVGHENLRKPDIAKAVSKAMEERLATTKTDADWLLSRFREEAEADIADIYTDSGNLKPVSEWPRVWRQGLVTGIEVEQLFEGTGQDRVQIGIITKVKHSDRIKRLELIGRHVGVQAFKDRVVHDVTDPLKQLMEQVSGQSIKPKDAG